MRFICLFLIFLVSRSAHCQSNQRYFTPAKNLSKIGIQEVFNGDLSFYQERILTKKVATEIGFGLMFRNFIKDFFQENNTSEQNKMLLGPSCNIKFKYYPYIPGEAFYVSSDYKFRRYRTQYSTLSAIGGNTLIFNEFSQRNIFRFGIGYVQCLDEHLFIDYYSSVGVSSILDQNIVPIFNNVNQEYTYIKDQYRNTLLHFVIGFKLGFRF
jgi:hypothetical protein